MSARDDYPWHAAMEDLNRHAGIPSALDEVDRLRCELASLSSAMGSDPYNRASIHPGISGASGDEISKDDGDPIALERDVDTEIDCKECQGTGLDDGPDGPPCQFCDGSGVW